MTENKINKIALNLITTPDSINSSHERYVYEAGYNDGVLDVCKSLKEALSEEDKSAEKEESANFETCTFIDLEELQKFVFEGSEYIKIPEFRSAGLSFNALSTSGTSGYDFINKYTEVKVVKNDD